MRYCATRTRTTAACSAVGTSEPEAGMRWQASLHWISRQVRSPSSGVALLAACAVLSLLGMSVASYLSICSSPCGLQVMPLPDGAEVPVLSDFEQDGRDLTLVTAYVNIGNFTKGNSQNQRNEDTYQYWIRAFASVRNPVVAYFDSDSMAAYFRKLRQGLPTKTLMFNRETSWAFSLKKETEEIFLQDDYPKKEPKSTNADYVCVMHAKYELVTHAVKANYFGTDHFAWLDAGFFRELEERGDFAPFSLIVPLCFNPAAVAFTAVQPQSGDTIHDIMREGVDWVGGGLFLATNRTMLAFATDYRRHAETLLYRHRLANADQAVIHVMYSPFNPYQRAVPLQAFLPDDTHSDPWFHLGYLMRRLSMERSKEQPGRARSESCRNEMFY